MGRHGNHAKVRNNLHLSMTCKYNSVFLIYFVIILNITQTFCNFVAILSDFWIFLQPAMGHVYKRFGLHGVSVVSFDGGDDCLDARSGQTENRNKQYYNIRQQETWKTRRKR